MKTGDIILPKGKSIQFLDYTIKNSSNNDGLVLSKPGGQLYECHLGNYGEGTKENIDSCKKDALLHFMVARPSEFAVTIVRKLGKSNSGTYQEFYKLQSVLKKENIEMPPEIHCGYDANCMIYFNNQPLTTIMVTIPLEVSNYKKIN